MLDNLLSVSREDKLTLHWILDEIISSILYQMLHLIPDSFIVNLLLGNSHRITRQLQHVHWLCLFRHN